MSRKVRMMNRFIENRLKKEGITGIVPSHGAIFMALLKYEAMTMKELAEKIDRDKSTLTGLVNKLIKMGYVEKNRCPEDGRISYISLTGRGKALEPVFMGISEELVGEIYRDFSEADQRELIRLLDMIEF